MNNDIPYKIEHSPAYASLVLNVPANQTVLVEASAMAAMDSGLKMKSKIKGGLLKGVGRMLGGESLFINEFTAQGRDAELYISPGVPGDIQHYYLTDECNLMVQSLGFVACSPNIELDSKFQGFKGFLVGSLYFYCELVEQEIFGLVPMGELLKFLLQEII